MKNRSLVCALAFALPALSPLASAQSTDDQAAELAMKLSNPISSLISVPFQANYDFGGGPAGDGVQFKLNIQPVIPIALSDDWNLISRTILPVIAQDDIIGTTSQEGLGDIVQSVFFSPSAATSSGWIWGAGPVLLFPTATNDFLGGEKWGAGPTAVVLKQTGGWTYGVLGNHIWSFAGDDSREDISATFVQPFLSYTTKHHTTYSINTESTYNWETSDWVVPVNVVASQLVKIGPMPVQFFVGGRYYVESPTNAPEWGVRFGVTLLFPTGG